MYRPATTMKDPYSGRRNDVLRAAANLYRQAREEGEFDFSNPASIVGAAVKDTTGRAARVEQHAEVARAHELTTSARVLARTALNLDKLHEAEGIKKVFPAIELVGRVLTEPFEVARIARSGLLDELAVLDLKMPNVTDPSEGSGSRVDVGQN
jgi:hypothetical protein